MAADDRREQLLDAASDVIAETGFDDLTMEAVTLRAGVSKGLGYAYFPRFDDLLHALFTREFSAIYLHLQAALDSPGTFEERLTRKVQAYFEIIARRRDVMLQLQRNLQGPEYRRERRARWSMWEDYVAKAIEDEYGAPETISKTAALLFMRVDAACIEAWYRHGNDRTEMERVCATFQISGLKALLTPDESATEGRDRSDRPRRTPGKRATKRTL